MFWGRVCICVSMVADGTSQNIDCNADVQYVCSIIDL